MADQLARTGSEHPFIGPKPACSISLELPRQRSGTGRTIITKTLGIHNWTQRGKGTYTRPSARRTKDLLKLNRYQLRWVVGLQDTCHLKRHFFKLGLTDDPTCERCLEKDESTTHTLCDCEAIAYLWFCHLGHFLMEPSDYYDTPINKVLHFIQSVRFIKG
jgi:hypothetical protein